jgi:hypothetical protein
MGIRKKSRAKFTFDGHLFVWWIDNEIYLRVASDDKRFVVGYLLLGDSSLLAVHGPDFPGLDDNQRPAWFTIPPLAATPDIGRHVNHIINACFKTNECTAFHGELPEYGACL